MANRSYSEPRWSSIQGAAVFPHATPTFPLLVSDRGTTPR
jgi:hypothetical protein